MVVRSQASDQFILSAGENECSDLRVVTNCRMFCAHDQFLNLWQGRTRAELGEPPDSINHLYEVLTP